MNNGITPACPVLLAAVLTIVGCDDAPTAPQPELESIPYEELTGKMAFKRACMGGRYAVLVDASARVSSLLPLKDDVNFWQGFVALSRDGTRIAYSGFEFNWNGPVYRRIYTMNTDGSHVAELTSGEGAGDFFPVFYASGEALLFVRGSAGIGPLFRIWCDGGIVTQITQFSVYGRASVSPDGSQIAFARDPSYQGHGIYVMNIDGSDRARVTVPDSLGLHYSPSWSPDGTRLAFVATDRVGSPDYFEIRIVDVSGANETLVLRLTEHTSLATPYVVWSPGGDRLAFNYGPAADGTTRSHVYLVDLDGSNLTQITSSAESDDGCPCWVQ